jgi:outer membrane protein TolC
LTQAPATPIQRPRDHGERESLAARNAQVQAEVQQATSLVTLCRALGGGWNGSAAVVATPR